MTPGQTAEVAAQFQQDGRTVPVGWPVTSQWGGDGVIVDGGDQAVGGSSAAAVARDAQAGVTHAAATVQGETAHGGGVQALEAGADVIRVNPRTGEITAVQPGTATLQVTVNGRTAETTVVVAGDEEPEPTDEPSDEPTGEPTDEPSDEPTGEPTDEPTGEPTGEPTDEPTDPSTPDPSGVPDPDGSDDPRDDHTDDSRDDDAAGDGRDDDGQLPRTGAQVTGLIGLALVLVAGGTAALTVGRRRRV
ncbi:MAG TPA: PT domain-containing protein [Candidatus Brevibacterium intestinigallinarum]|nr:PT domain-containing protein [Candidatus Brevibacterium intestinigallinarum]